MSCSCEDCHGKRGKFMDILKDMSGGYGVKRTKIHKHLNELPEPFINDLRQLLVKMRHEGGNKAISPKQRSFFTTYKRLLSDFVKTDPRSLMAKKRKFGDKRLTFAQALGQMIHENPSTFKNVMSHIHGH